MAQTRRRKTRSSARAAASASQQDDQNASSQDTSESQESQDEQQSQQQEVTSEQTEQEVESQEEPSSSEKQEEQTENIDDPPSPVIEPIPPVVVTEQEILQESKEVIPEEEVADPEPELESQVHTPEPEMQEPNSQIQESELHTTDAPEPIVLQPEIESQETVNVPEPEMEDSQPQIHEPEQIIHEPEVLHEPEVKMLEENKDTDKIEETEEINEPPQDVDMAIDSPDVVEMDESDSKQDQQQQQQVVLEDNFSVEEIKSQKPVHQHQLQEEKIDATKEEQAQKGTQKSKKKKKRRRKKAKSEQRMIEIPASEDDSGVEVEYVSEKIDLPKWDPSYEAFHKIFEAFKLEEKPILKEEETVEKKPVVETVTQDNDDDDDDDDDEADKDKKDEPEKISKKQLKKQSRMEIATLKQMVTRPDVVETHDVNSKDPQLLVYLKAYKNTVPVPRHWCFKRKYLAGKRGFVKPPFELPDFIKQTGIMEMRAAMQEKEDSKSLKTKQRGKIRPKLGKIDIDYQKLHDAFFKFQTKPKMTIHGDLYYEGKEFEIRLKEKKPGDLSDDLRTALGMPVGPGKVLIPPPWLIAMQRYGPPPSYPNLKIPGLNAPIPEGSSFGYHAGGWGKPPVDEVGKPLYGDVFGISSEDTPQVNEEDNIDKTPWGALESESESEEESDEEEEDEDQTGLVTPGDAGLVTPSGISSVGAGLETPDMLELRKRKEIEDAMETGGDTPALYTVLAEKRTAVGASMMGSQHTYDLAPPKKAADGVEITLDPSELELEPAAMAAKYDDTMKEREANVNREDFSDMVAEHAAKKKRKKPTDSGKAAKKYKEFKF